MSLPPPQHLYWAFLILAILTYGNLYALWLDLMSLNSNLREYFYVFMGRLHNSLEKCHCRSFAHFEVGLLKLITL